MSGEKISDEEIEKIVANNDVTGLIAIVMNVKILEHFTTNETLNKKQFDEIKDKVLAGDL